METFISLLILAHASAIFGKILPDSIPEPLCRRSDPNLGECLLNSTGRILPILGRGLPSINFDAIDPSYLEFTTIEFNANNVRLNATLTDTAVYGLSDIKFNKIEPDRAALNWEVSCNVPLLHVMTKFTAAGLLFTIPLESTARFDGNFSSTDIILQVHLKEVKRKGIRYFAIEKIEENMRVNKTKVKLISVDPTQQPAVTVIENFFNQNDRLVMDTIRPLFNTYISAIIKHVLSRFLRTVPAEELLTN